MENIFTIFTNIKGDNTFIFALEIVFLKRKKFLIKYIDSFKTNLLFLVIFGF